MYCRRKRKGYLLRKLYHKSASSLVCSFRSFRENSFRSEFRSMAVCTSKWLPPPGELSPQATERVKSKIREGGSLPPGCKCGELRIATPLTRLAMTRILESASNRSPGRSRTRCRYRARQGSNDYRQAAVRIVRGDSPLKPPGRSRSTGRGS